MTLRVFREPAAQDALFLHEHLADAPEAGEGESADDGGHGVILHKERQDGAQDACEQPEPPAPLAQVILHFDDGRVADADAEEDGGTDQDSIEIHCFIALL